MSGVEIDKILVDFARLFFAANIHDWVQEVDRKKGEENEDQRIKGWTSGSF